MEIDNAAPITNSPTQGPHYPQHVQTKSIKVLTDGHKCWTGPFLRQPWSKQYPITTIKASQLRARAILILIGTNMADVTHTIVVLCKDELFC